MNKIQKSKLLQELKQKMIQDNSLPLKKGATNLVFGLGNPDSEILFIGEGPGYWEDQKSEPFVGNAGKLLDSLFSSIKLEREDVFITNVVHHRPPENRDPLPNEIEAYGKYLDEIIKIINPKMIITLGRFSMGKFLPEVKISAVHGKKFSVNWESKNVIVVPMYHPAAGLRSLEVKRQLMSDFIKLPEVLEEIKRQVAVEKEREKQTEQMNLI